MGLKLLNLSEDDLYLISNKILDIAKKNGATASEVELSVSSGKTISTRMGALETIELNNGKSLSATVFSVIIKVLHPLQILVMRLLSLALRQLVR